MAQLVARDFWEVEAAGSSPVTQTRIKRRPFEGRFLIKNLNIKYHKLLKS